MNRPGRPVAIIQARMGSHRFPGKMLEPIDGVAMGEHVWCCATMAKLVDRVVVAIPDGPHDDILQEHLEAAGMRCFRGPGDDVLQRMAWAAAAHWANKVVRICGDSPRMPPNRIDALLEASGGYDYVGYKFSDGTPAIREPWGTFPEVIGMDALEIATHTARAPADREHVTSSIYYAQHHYNVKWLPAERPIEGLNVDVPDDIARLEGTSIAQADS